MEVQLLSMSIKILFLTITIALLFGTVFIESFYSQEDAESFDLFQRQYRKQYRLEERSYRQHIFMSNKAMIDAHNLSPQRSFSMEINSFADLTLSEFKMMHLGTVVSNHQRPQVNFDDLRQIYIQSIDWQQQGKVTPIKNQKMCASCWAFSVIGAIQSLYMIHKQPHIFAEQQLVDCSNTYGNKGCHGGELDLTYQYVIDKGLNLQSSYPYIGKDQNCKKTHGPFKIGGFSKAITCSAMVSALKRGPVTVAVDAIYWGFYKEGIFDYCSGEGVNHGVLVVGVNDRYWRIKNSWGTQWGQQGYMDLKIGNTCAVCEYAYYPEF